MRRARGSILQHQTRRIEHEGQSWTIRYKIYHDEIRVYRVEGDITKPEALEAALQAFAGEQGLALLMADAI